MYLADPSIQPQTPQLRKLERLRSGFGAVLEGRTGKTALLQSFLTKFLVVGINACTSIIVARTLQPQGRGEMSALAIWSGFLAGMLTLGLPSALIFSLRHKAERSSSTVGIALVLGLVLSIAIAILGFVVLPFWLSNYPARVVTQARWFLFSSPIPIFLLIGRSAMEAKGKFAQSNLAWWLGPVTTLIALGVLAGTHTLRPLTGSLAYVLGSVPPLLCLVYQVLSTYRPSFMLSFAGIADLLHYGVRAWGVDLLNALSLQADQVLVIRFLNPKQMGIYVVAASFARLLSIFQTSAVMVLFPKIAARERNVVLSLTGRTFRVTTAAAAACGVLLWLCGPVLLSRVYGHSYATGGALVFRLLLLEVVLGGATQVIAQAYMALGRPGTVTLIQALGVSVGVLSMPSLITHFGIAGAAGALLLSSVIRLTCTLCCLWPALGIPPLRLFDFESSPALVSNPKH